MALLGCVLSVFEEPPLLKKWNRDSGEKARVHAKLLAFRHETVSPVAIGRGEYREGVSPVLADDDLSFAVLFVVRRADAR